ncbi:MAG: ROK family protein [Anaerolineales bacterium]
MADFAIGVDLGATNLRLGRVDAAGEISGFKMGPVPWQAGATEVVRTIAEQVRGLPDYEAADGIGVAVAATLSPEGQILEGPHNLPQEFSRFPLSKLLEKELSLPCLLGNDANLALLGEGLYGAARGAKDVLLLTLGTGVGAGVMLGGEIRTGQHGSAAEIGLWPVQVPATGSFVPVESLAAPGAVMDRLERSGEDLFALVDSGAREAEEASKLMFRLLGQLITHVHLLLDLDLVILTGGLVAAGERVRTEVEAAFQSICPTAYQFDLSIQLGSLPPDQAGVIGAAGQFLRS